MKEKTVHTVATAHLDTIWNWDFEHTVTKCIYNTLVKNFELFEKYPDYEFNFEGSYRYELMEEYYPELFAKLKQYVADGRWHPVGSSFENGDVNIPSPEALFRNILYGNEYFSKTFGVRSKDIFLPDCFGFGWALPAIANHSNLLGFSTQKLGWGSAYGVPFDIGRWYGVNGKFIFASVNPHAYDRSLKKIRNWKFISQKLEENDKFDLDMTYVYHGVGDQGGAPKEHSVKVVTDEMKGNQDSHIKIISASSDKIFKDLAKGEYQKLPEWKNELVMKNHAVGGYTSRAIGKRWNRRNEELADMAERSAVTANVLGTSVYPKKQFEIAWKRIIAHQFHDDIPGTSVQRAYKRSWNDYALSLNQFAGEFVNSVDSITRIMDTSFAKGTAVVVNNSLEFERTSLVTTSVRLDNCKCIRVFDADGREYPCQINSRIGSKIILSFVATVPPLGFKVFDVRTSETPFVDNGLKVSENSLENQRYVVSLNSNGDVASIFDKSLGRELLAAPVELGLYDYKGSKDWPAWELNYKEINCKPQRIARLSKVEILENGSARVALKITQNYNNSTFTTIVALNNMGQRVEFFSEVMWHSLQTLLKNQFAFTSSNKIATYDLGLGAIERENSSEKLFEVPAQKWVDITDTKDDYGVSVISECKYGWDKPADNTLRMTVVHTPQRNYRKDSMQSFMDLGLNRYSFAVLGHDGGNLTDTQRQSRSFLQPLTAFVVGKHSGEMGVEFSFGVLDNQHVILRGMKMAENSDEIIVRFNEGSNHQQKNVRFTLGEGIESAREVFASEEAIDVANVSDGALVFDIAPYDVKSFALKLEESSVQGTSQKQVSIPVPYNIRSATSNNSTGDGVIGSKPFSIPKDLFPKEIYSRGVTFKMGGITKGTKNALIGGGQTLSVPDGFNAVSILCGSLNGDKKFDFSVGDSRIKVKIHEIDSPVGGWDLYDLGETAFVRNAPVAWEVTHTHSNGADNVAHQIYFYQYLIPLNGASSLTLPNNKDFFLLAATAVNKEQDCTLATALYDKVSKRPFSFTLNKKEKLNYKFFKTTAEWHK